VHWVYDRPTAMALCAAGCILQAKLPSLNT
jgi:hypothetical protein